ncbi:MAG TPA: ribosome biogenesis GTPase Der [Longimicrobiales bacterium]|nr:ribosome biogenesis GTPase Der [Longimicrobiales bacterium]
MRQGLPVVAVLGRPNVGKSTFFNRVLGERRAIVQDQPGVTRDRNFAQAEWAGRRFFLVDTGGLEPETEEVMTKAIRRQVEAAIAEADLLVFMVDGLLGPHPLDHRIAELLRRTELPVVVVVNKLDRLPNEVAQHEFWELGLGEPYPVSSIQGRGSGDLLDVIVAHLPPTEPEGAEDSALYIAVVGKPNVGKSSFVNRLLGEERMVVSEVAGTTRDSIDTPMRYHGHDLVFVDTAGLRRQARMDRGLEYYSALRTERAIERADVCLLLLDGTEPVHVQDLKIAEKAWNAGCALIVIVNKWDLVEKTTNTAVEFERLLRQRARAMQWVPVLFTSALTGQRVQKVLDLVLEVAATRSRRIATSEVNDVLRELAARRPPPHFRGMPVKLLYATQVATKPPTFVVFTNQPKGIPDHYLRYLHNGFRAAWSFTGSPLRIRLRGRRREEATH